MKNTKLYSVLFNKCPRCHEGDFFISKNPYDFKNFTKIHDKCSHCGEHFMKEIGFYYGSMYVSYGLTIGLGMVMFVLNYFVLGLSEIPFLICFSVIALLLWTWIFRKARLIWINIFVKFNKALLKKKTKA